MRKPKGKSIQTCRQRECRKKLFEYGVSYLVEAISVLQIHYVSSIGRIGK